VIEPRTRWVCASAGIAIRAIKATLTAAIGQNQPRVRLSTIECYGLAGGMAGVPPYAAGMECHRAPRRHAPLANCAVKVGHLKWSNVVDECRVLSRDLKADGWMSGPPRVITRDQVLATVDLAWNGPLWLPWPTGWSGHWALLAPEGDCVMLGSRSR
jgi:hypothetical protein